MILKYGVSEISFPQAHYSEVVCDEHLLQELLLGNIKAWFQPKHRLSDGKLIGAEALARWERYGHGVVGPEGFLPQIHTYALERELLHRILDDAVNAQMIWRSAGYRIPVSVNLPVPLLDVQELADRLYDRVVARGGCPQDICFELLEDERTSSPESYRLGANRLRQKGFGLALDDFGCAYGSLRNLISAPFTEVKIDRIFVQGCAVDVRKHAVLASSIELGRRLGLAVTAEGVETTKDLEVLKREGCDYAQGYLFMQPLDLEAFGKMLAAARGGTN